MSIGDHGICKQNFNMNWYKTSKLADKDPSEEKATYVRCMYCKKFLTDPSGLYTRESHLVPSNWKSPEEMDPEELKQYEMSINYTDPTEPIGISDGMCPPCKEYDKKKTMEYLERKKRQ